MGLISRTAQHGIRALIWLAAQQDRVTVKDLAVRIGAPQPYLARIVIQLAEAGYIDARRGPGGGLKLARPPSDITLFEIVKVFDEATPFEECPLGLPGCAEGGDDCPAHTEWSQLQERVLSWWRDTTVASLVARGTPAKIQKGLKARP